MTPLATLIGGVLQNLLVLLGLTLILSRCLRLVRRVPPRRAAALLGALFGAVAIGLMTISFELAEGIRGDLRNVVVVTSAVFGGPLSAIITAALAFLFRLPAGNPHLAIAGLSLASAAVLGIAFWTAGFAGTPLRLALLGLALAVLNSALPFGSLLLGDMDLPQAGMLAATILAPALVVYPLALVLVGEFLTSELARLDEEATLRSSNLRLSESEQRFQAVFDMSSVAMAWADAVTGRFVRVNKRYCELTGYGEAELIGRPFHDLAHPEDRPADLAVLQAQAAGEVNSLSGEKRYIRKDGAVVWAFRTITVVREHGQPRYAFAIVLDVTERKQLDDSLQDSQARFRDFAESASDWLWETDAEMRLTLVLNRNQAIRDFTAALIGKTRWEIAGEDPADPLWRRHIEDLAARRPFRDFEYCFEVDGDIRWVSVNGKPFFDPAGVFLGYRGTTSDLTARKRAEAKIEAGARQQEAVASLSRKALQSADLPELFQAAADLVAATLAVDLVSVSELSEARKSLRVIAGSGWRPGTVGMAEVTLDAATLAADALRSSGPVILLPTQMARKMAPYLREHGAVCGLAVGIGDTGRRLGVLAAFATRARLFTASDADFLQAIAFVLAAAAERVQLEAQLRQAQKMEAVGHLTGGIAHDFNNLLAVILGNAEILSEEIEEPLLKEFAEMVVSAAERGAELTERLLAFARRQTLRPEAVDLGRALEGIAGMLRRSIGEGIVLRTGLPPKLAPALVDRPLFESAILNLAVNARDAMGGSGILTVDVAAVADADRPSGLPPGRYLAVSVADTGEGIPPEIVDRVFEPFFTTKAIGKGSGLGLAMVYGFARQSGGTVTVASRPGEGAVVTMFLPQADHAALPESRGPASPDVPAGQERLLVVEDEEEVRRIVATQLRGLGYAVVEAATAAAALRMLEEDSGIEALFTDLMLPEGMSGLELAERAQRLRPGLKVLLTSGYSEDAIDRHGSLAKLALLKKPYRRQELSGALRTLLDAVDSPRPELAHFPSMPPAQHRRAAG